VNPPGVSCSRRTRNGSCGHGDLPRAGGNQGLDSLPSLCLPPIFYSRHSLLSSIFFLRLVSVQLWRKVSAETTVELQLLFEKWRLLLAGIVFQVKPSICSLNCFPRVLKYQAMPCSASCHCYSLSLMCFKMLMTPFFCFFLLALHCIIAANSSFGLGDWFEFYKEFVLWCSWLN
jgi:hypothetical protein